MIVRCFAGILACLVLAVCCTDALAVDRSQLVRQIRTARQEGRFTDAIHYCEALLSDYEHNPVKNRWKIDTWTRQTETLKAILGLPAKAQEEMAEAYRLAPRVSKCLLTGEQEDCDAILGRVIAIRRQHLGAEHPDVAASCADRARFLDQCGRYLEAEELLLHSIELTTASLGPEHPAIALRLSALGKIHANQEEYAEAEIAHLAACALCEKTKGRVSSEFARILNNLAAFYSKCENHAAADPLYRRSIAINRRLSGGANSTLATQLHNLAHLCMDRGDPLAAEPLFREALEIKLTLAEKPGRSVANTMGDLAEALFLKRDLDGAEKMCRGTLRIQFGAPDDEYPRPTDVVLSEVPPVVVETLRLLGHVQMQQDRIDHAAQTCALALTWARHFHGEEHSAVARLFKDQGRILMRRGSLEESELLLRRALEILRSRVGDQHPDVVLALKDLGECLFLQGNVDAAEQQLTLAADHFETARLRTGRGLERVTFQRSPYRQLAGVRLMQGRKQEAWQATERALGRALADLLVAADQRPLTDTERNREAALWDSVKQGQDCHDFLVTQHHTSPTAGSADAVYEARTRWREADAALSTFEQEMLAKYPVTSGQCSSLEDIQTALPARTAIMGWLHAQLPNLMTEDWGYVIRDSGPIAWVQLARTEGGEHGGSLLTEADQYRRVLRDSAQQGIPQRLVWSIKSQARHLWKRAMQPLEPYLQGADRLVVIPDEPMLGIPIESLVDHSEQYVGDRFICSYVPSASIWRWLKNRATNAPLPHERTALLIGDPPFAEAHLVADNLVVPLDDDLVSESQALGVLRGDSVARSTLPPLHGTRDEILDVAGMFSTEPTILMGLNASEEQVVAHLGKGKGQAYDTILIATHTIMNPTRSDRSMMIFSQLGLCDPLEAIRRGEPLYDGCLSAREVIRQFDLDADLVVVSSCQTALGECIEGEGYVGLAHAFMQAGARNLLVSLWKVDDRATAALVKRFFENLMGTDASSAGRSRAVPMAKSAALQEAKQWLRTQKDSQGNTFEHPIYWAGFVLVGGGD